MFRIIATGMLVAGLMAAQNPAPRSVVVASGDASVAVTPDQARLTFTVTTQAQTAQAAASQNASTAANVIAQVAVLLKTAGDIKTISYNINPNYNNASQIIGYTANNSIAATINDLSLVGSLIDTGINAGASRVDSLSFGLKDDSAPKAQALRQATQKAKAKADAMALALGLRTGSVIVIQEAGTSVVATDPRAGIAAVTPIVAGTVDVRANVTIELALIQ